MPKQSILQRAFKGHVEKCHNDLGISQARLYELIGTDDPYERTWRLLRALAFRNPEGLRMIADDFNSRVAALVGSSSGEIDMDRWVNAITDETVPERQRRRVIDAFADLQRYLETNK